jgi:hypothetical protein
VPVFPWFVRPLLVELLHIYTEVEQFARGRRSRHAAVFLAASTCQGISGGLGLGGVAGVRHSIAQKAMDDHYRNGESRRARRSAIGT